MNIGLKASGALLVFYHMHPSPTGTVMQKTNQGVDVLGGQGAATWASQRDTRHTTVFFQPHLRHAPAPELGIKKESTADKAYLPVGRCMAVESVWIMRNHIQVTHIQCVENKDIKI